MKVYKSPFNKLYPLPLKKVGIEDKFWSLRQKINKEISIPLQFEKLKGDHHIQNFKVAGGIEPGIHKGEFYYDSDLYKWMEAGCYTLKNYPSDQIDANKLKKQIDKILNFIEQSQERDGYINTFFSTLFLEKRFTNMHIFHELYCAGHLIETAISYYEIFGQEKFLAIAQKFADFLVNLFLNKKYKGAPGHEEIELALIKLFRVTKKKDYLDLAEDFIKKRGNIRQFKTYAINQYINMANTLNKATELRQEDKSKANSNKECEKEDSEEIAEFLANLGYIDWIKLIRANLNGEVYQLHKPVRKAFEPVGHAVRAVYLYSGMADLYSETGDDSILKALELLWLKMTRAKMYITGGIGSVKATEGFGKDFALKNKDSYSETCAAIGNIMWNWRMLNITGKSKYADLIELLLYNAFLAGQSLDGKAYFYSNPMVSSGEDKREEWFLCPCCPTNFIRLIGSLEQYIYSISEDSIWIHQYIGSKSNIDLFNKHNIILFQETEFPWNGNSKLTVDVNNQKEFSINLRIPEWAEKSNININGTRVKLQMNSGTYVKINRKWRKGDIIDTKFKMNPKLSESDPRIRDNLGKRALRLGPLIYCLEQVDHKEYDIFEMKISKTPQLRVKFISDLLGGVNIIEGKTSQGSKFRAIPYFAWCNREPTRMQVWNKYED